MSEENHTPDVLLLTGNQCPWCPGVLDALKQLQAEGTIAALETVNIEEQPAIAAELGVRAVPWIRIGPFELEGNRSMAELRKWAIKSGTIEGLSSWMEELLSRGKIDSVSELVSADPSGFEALLMLFTHPDTQLNARIGISAVMEGLQETPLLKDKLDQLEPLTRHPEPQIRGDACHFLALSKDDRAITIIEPLLNDTDPDVAEIARESIEELRKL